jgi:hypothetical protein
MKPRLRQRLICAIIGGVSVGALGTAAFGAWGHTLIPPEEWGPLGLATGAFMVGAPVCILAGTFIGLAVHAWFSSATKDRGQRAAPFLGLSLGILTGATLGMIFFFESERLWLIYGTTIAVAGLSYAAGRLLAVATRIEATGATKHKP